MNESKDLAPKRDLPPAEQAFEFIQRRAKLYTQSALVPEIYRGNTPGALANTIIALNIAARIHADELMVMQNLYVIEGRPSWSSTFIISALNSCGRFSPLHFEVKDLGPRKVVFTQSWKDKNTGERKSVDKSIELTSNLSCTAWAYDISTGEKLIGPEVSYEMAILEGWWTRFGSKWQTMPELMLRYRAASFFGRLYAPEMLNGMYTREEVEDMPELPRPAGRSIVPEDIVKTAAPATPAKAEETTQTHSDEILTSDQYWEQLSALMASPDVPATAKKEIAEANAEDEKDPKKLKALLEKVTLATL